MMLYWEISYFTLFLYFSFSSPPRAVGVSLLEMVPIRGVPRLSAVMIRDLAPNTHNGIFYVCRNSSISNVTLNVKMSIDKGTIVLSVFIIIIVQWSEISYKFHIVQRMYGTMYCMFERKVWTIFHVFLIYSIECPLHLWFQMCKMFKKIWICDKQMWKQMELSPFISANFVHLFLVLKPTIVKHCTYFIV